MVAQRCGWARHLQRLHPVELEDTWSRQTSQLGDQDKKLCILCIDVSSGQCKKRRKGWAPNFNVPATQVVTIVGAGHRSVDVLVVVDGHVSVLSLSTCRLFLKLRRRDLGLELFRSFALWLCSGICPSTNGSLCVAWMRKSGKQKVVKRTCQCIQDLGATRAFESR